MSHQTIKTIRFLIWIALCFNLSTIYASHDVSGKHEPDSSLFSDGVDVIKSIFTPTQNLADTLLTGEEAFAINPIVENNDLLIQWKIAEKYYLYRDKFKFLVDGQKIHVDLPQGVLKKDPLFGEVQVYYHSVSAKIPQNIIKNRNQLEVYYQGCAELGVCYPPQKTSFNLNELFFPSANAASTIPQNTPEQDSNTQNLLPSRVDNSSIRSETDDFIEYLSAGKTWISIGLFFLAGLLLAFTPCVFPLIPIISGILVQQGKKLSSRRGFLISGVYVLSISITYALIGIAAGLLGNNLQTTLQHPIALSAFALLFVLLAFSMFGFYQIQIPLAWQNKLNSLFLRKQNSPLISTIIMGFLSALIVGPCVAPPFAGALIYIGQTGDAFTGGTSLFAMSLGMGTPLMMFGGIAGKLLPKAAAWMDKIKTIFGVMMIAMAIYFLDRFIPTWLSMILWGSFFIVIAIYMGAFEPIPQNKDANVSHRERGWKFFFKSIAWIFMLLGIILIIGFASGGRSLLQPLSHLNQSNYLTSSVYPSDIQSAQAPTPKFVGKTIPFQKIDSGRTPWEKLEQAKKTHTPVMIYVTAEWCITCRELEAFTFSDQSVIASMQSQIAYSVDVSKNNVDDLAFMKSLNIVGPPAILFIDSNGVELRNYRVIGFISADEFEQRIQLWKKS